MNSRQRMRGNVKFVAGCVAAVGVAVLVAQILPDPVGVAMGIGVLVFGRWWA